VKVGDYVKINLYPGANGFIVPKPPTAKSFERGAIYVLLTKADSGYVGKIYAFRPNHIEVLSEGG